MSDFTLASVLGISVSVFFVSWCGLKCLDWLFGEMRTPAHDERRKLFSRRRREHRVLLCLSRYDRILSMILRIARTVAAFVGALALMVYGALHHGEAPAWLKAWAELAKEVMK